MRSTRRRFRRTGGTSNEKYKPPWERHVVAPVEKQRPWFTKIAHLFTSRTPKSEEQFNRDLRNKTRRANSKKSLASKLWRRIKKTAKKIKRYVSGENSHFDSSSDTPSPPNEEEAEVIIDATDEIDHEIPMVPFP